MKKIGDERGHTKHSFLRTEYKVVGSGSQLFPKFQVTQNRNYVHEEFGDCGDHQAGSKLRIAKPKSVLCAKTV